MKVVHKVLDKLVSVKGMTAVVLPFAFLVIAADANTDSFDSVCLLVCLFGHKTGAFSLLLPFIVSSFSSSFTLISIFLVLLLSSSMALVSSPHNFSTS